MNYLELLDAPPRTVQQTILDSLRHGPKTSLEVFAALGLGQDCSPEQQFEIDDALDQLHAEGRVLLTLPDGRWHLREGER